MIGFEWDPAELEDELEDQIERVRAALSAPPHERVHRALQALPSVLVTLERISEYRTEVQAVREHMARLMQQFREEVAAIQRRHPGETYRAGHIVKITRQMLVVLDRIDYLLGRKPE